LSDNSKHIDQLIARYLSGEATKSELLLLERWMAESDVNKKYFEGIQFVHDKAVASYTVVKFDVDKAWNKLHSKMHEVPEIKNEQTRVIKFYSNKLFQAAASVALLIGISVFIYFYTQSPNKLLHTLAYSSTDSTINCSIDTNTKVFLNKRTTLSYTEYTNSREAILEGEAYFNIKHSDKKPLIVQAKGTLVKDIGTSYNVKAYDSTETVEVYVESGTVVFYTSNNPGIILNAGETGVFNKKTKVFSKKFENNSNAIVYKTGVLEFQNTSLADIIIKLKETYKTELIVRDSLLLKRRLTVTFDNEVLNIISETLNVTISKSSEGFVITDNSTDRK
jgi:transmembrane sensor